jgi:hypothetical protein
MLIFSFSLKILHSFVLIFAAYIFGSGFVSVVLSFEVFRGQNNLGNTASIISNMAAV